MTIKYAIGVDLGGTRVKAAAIRPDGESLAHLQRDFEPGTELDWATKIRELIQAIQREQRGEPHWIGLAAPGLAATDARSIAHMPGRLQGLEGLDWTPYLGLVKMVPVLNDAHAALLGESWVGAAKGFKDVFMLTLGTGVGGAALVAGQLLKGHIGRGGHLGHSTLDPNGPPDIAGTPGSLELAIGNCSLAQRSGGRFRSTHQLVQAHLHGDAEATAVWLKSVHALACAVASFINILDPEAGIIGGGIARADHALFGPLQYHLDQIEWRPGGHKVKILPAALGEFAGAIGAAYNAMRHSGVQVGDRGWRVEFVPFLRKGED